MSKRRIKTPIDHPLMKFVRKVYPRVEKTWPWLAHSFAFQFFFMPMKFKRPKREEAAFASAIIDVIEYQNKNAHIFSWGSSKNPTVLLVHGWMGRATQFHEFINELKDSFHVISFDAPAHGESKGWKTDISEFANIIEYIEAKHGPIHSAVGHSLGGAALVFAANQGTPIKKLSMIASPTIGSKILESYSKILNGSVKTIESFDRKIKKKFKSEFKDFAALNLITKVDIPDLQLIYDQDDKEVGIEHGHEMKKVRPDARFLETSGLGHSRILRDSETVKKIVEFIEFTHAKT